MCDYINYGDNIIPTVTVRCFPNNKAWIFSNLKELLNKRKSLQRERQGIIEVSTKTTESEAVKQRTRRCTGESWRTSSSRTSYVMCGQIMNSTHFSNSASSSPATQTCIFPVTSQLSHLPPQLWTLVLLHCCLQEGAGATEATGTRLLVQMVSAPES